jgi:hypothetical protein
MRAIHRDDGELCGYVHAHDGSWHAVSVFGGLLDVAESNESAEQIVREVGLVALAERWLLTTSSEPEEQVVCLQEASPTGVTVAIGYYSLPGVPTLRVTRAQIDNGQMHLRRAH